LPDFSWYNIPKREKISNDEKYTKREYTISNAHKIYQQFPIQDPPKNYQKWDFWFENIPSGNPGISSQN
jgi:hypothetical protein